MRNFILLFLLSVLGNVSTSYAESSACLYTSIYNVGEKTWLLFNVVEKLTLSKWNNETEFLQEWQKAQSQVRSVCGEEWPSTPQSVVVSNGEVLFSLNGFSYQLKTTQADRGQRIILTRTSGNYADQSLMTSVFVNGKKQFVHIVGRDGVKQDIERYDFVFAGEEANLVHQSYRDFSVSANIKSLKNIYGSVPEKVPPRLHVGVIGSGLDYNHPDLAKLLAHRDEMESELQGVELLREKIKIGAYWSHEELVSDKNTYQEKMKRVGFPLWMDQALGLPRPFDLVMTDPYKISGDHETKVTSRILSRGDSDVQLHFARRMFGSMDVFDAETVVENFYQQGVRLVNMSFGSACGLLPREEAQWKKVFKKYSDMVFVVSAGNSGLNVDQTPFCPAFYSRENKNVVSVTGLGTTGDLAAYDGATVNYGKSVDVAIRADDLMVLPPHSVSGAWILNSRGGTSLAAAEVTRVLAEAYLDGYVIDAQKVKMQLMRTSVKRDSLKSFVGSSGEISEAGFRQALLNSNSF